MYTFFVERRIWNKNEGRINTVSYSLRFSESGNFMNLFLDSLVSNISDKTFNAECIHCEKCEKMGKTWRKGRWCC